MFDTFKKLPEMFQGLVYTFAGAVLLLYSLGFIEKGITIIIALFAICLIAVGVVKAGFYKKALDTLHKK